MSYNNPNITTSDLPGIDAAIYSLQTALATKFSWMKVFHRAYPFREKNMETGRKYDIPKVWIGGNEYMNILPNDFLKGQAFFVLTGEEDVKVFNPSTDMDIEVSVSLIIWVNTSQIPGHVQGPSIANLKADVLELIGSADHVLKIKSFTDQDAEEIFDGFTIDDIDTQYLMLPYAGLRVNMILKYNYSIC